MNIKSQGREKSFGLSKKSHEIVRVGSSHVRQPYCRSSVEVNVYQDVAVNK